jgi:hypothetical protein
MPKAFCRSHPRLVPMNTQSGVLCDPASLVLYRRCHTSSRPHARSTLCRLTEIMTILYGINDQTPPRFMALTGQSCARAIRNLNRTNRLSARARTELDRSMPRSTGQSFISKCLRPNLSRQDWTGQRNKILHGKCWERVCGRLTSKPTNRRFSLRSTVGRQRRFVRDRLAVTDGVIRPSGNRVSDFHAG